MSDLRRAYHQKSRSWGSFNRQSRLAKQQQVHSGYNYPESKRRTITKSHNHHRSRDTLPRMTRRKSEGDRHPSSSTTPTASRHASPKCLPGLGGGHSSPSPRTVIRPSIFCSPLQRDQFVPLDDDTFSTVARSEHPQANVKTNNNNKDEHYSQIWLSNHYDKEEEYAKKKWGVSARNRGVEHTSEGKPEDQSPSPERELRRNRHSRASSNRTSILDREIEQLARALHQVPTGCRKAEPKRRELSVTFDESPFASSAQADDPAVPASDFPFSADFDVFGDCSDKSATLEDDFGIMKKKSSGSETGTFQPQKKTFVEKEIFFEEAFNRREQDVPPRRSLPIHIDEQELLHDASNNIPSIFRPSLRDSETHNTYEHRKELQYHEEKKEADAAPGIQDTKLNIQNQALFKPEDLDFGRQWTTQQPIMESNLGGSSFDDHLAQLKIDTQEDANHEPKLGRDEIILEQSTLSKDESNIISEITATFSSEEYLNHIAKERESILQQNESACRKAKCYVFYNTLFSEEKSSEEFPAHVKDMVTKLESLNRLEADFAEEFGYKDFIPIQDQKENEKKKEANLRLRLLNGFAEEAFTEGDGALNYMNDQCFSFENESTVIISPVD